MDTREWWILKRERFKCAFISESRVYPEDRTKCDICRKILRTGDRLYMEADYEGVFFAHEDCVDRCKLCKACSGRGYTSNNPPDLFSLMTGAIDTKDLLGLNAEREKCFACQGKGYIRKKAGEP